MEEQIDEHLEEEQLLDEDIFDFPLRIFEGDWQKGVPSQFDAVTIFLDGRAQADLDWKKVSQQARCAVEKGYALMWDIQLGLFNELTQPLTHQGQFLTLALCLEYFRDSLWKEFKSHTIGVSIFRGKADFSQGFSWDSHQEQNLKEWIEEIGESSLASLDFSQLQDHLEGQRLIRLFCRDVAIEYLSLLASRVPDSLSTYLYLDATSLGGSLLNEIQLLNPERFDRLKLALKGHRLPFEVLGWETPTPQGYSGCCQVNLPLSMHKTIGVCLPPSTFYHSHYYQGLEEALEVLHERAIAFKLISESHLTSQWDGLDAIVYHPAGLSKQGKRQLQGFCAAGGTVVATGSLLGFSNELNLGEWLKTL